ncbi:hypothetical protein DRJ48_03905 [Candidatus Woesearchaeota archaeon]|nr:protein kinase [Candidatus Woesearchaeota archaeon]RLE42250.1 MAG: hypothetical protein DRJ48_03905 [Candidatus Woesearchaeota archaeon]
MPRIITESLEDRIKKDGRFNIIRTIQLNPGVSGVFAVSVAKGDYKGMRLALKVSAKRDEETVNAFKREIEIPRAVRSKKHVINTYEVNPPISSTRGSSLLAVLMELGDKSLYEYLTQEERSLSTALDIIEQIGLGIKAVHEAGYYHGDIKPQNVIHVRDVWKLSDFADSGMFLIPTTTKGTDMYRAPECYDIKPGECPYSVQSDVYALGCLIYQLLGDGELPWRGYKGKPMLRFKKDMRRLEKVVLKSSTGWLPGVKERHKRVILKCLMPQREHRYGSSDEVLEELKGGAGRRTKPRPELQQFETLYTQLKALLEEGEQGRGKYGNTPMRIIKEIRELYEMRLVPLVGELNLEQLSSDAYKRFVELGGAIEELKKRDERVIEKRYSELERMLPSVSKDKVPEVARELCREGLTLVRIAAYWGILGYSFSEIEARKTGFDKFVKDVERKLSTTLSKAKRV